MRCFRYLLSSTVFFICVAWYNLMPVFAQEASIIRATQVDSTVIKNGAPLNEGDIVQRDDRIVCKAKSAAVLTWSNGSMVKLYPNTSIVLRGIAFENDRKMEKSFLTLENGRIFVKAQVPEHIFEHFELNVGNTPVKAQAAEFAVKYDNSINEFQVWSLIGTLIVNMEVDLLRVNEGQQVKIIAGANPEGPASMPDKIRTALVKVSKILGGSLLIEEESGSIGGPLKVKIGGVRNRRGNVPYTVKFKAVTKGGSGKIKSIHWSFGDGESAKGKATQHTFTQGVYGVTVSVEDENGDISAAQINISVEEDCDC